MEYLPQWFIAISLFVLGLLIGSFLNVVIYRLPRRESIVFPGSHCTGCDAAIRFYDNIPVMSYAMLGGRCRNCSVRISPVYPAVELLTGSLYALLFLRAGLSLTLLGDILFVSLIVPLVFIDLKHKLLLNVLTYPGIVILFAMRLIAPVQDTQYLFGLSQQPGIAQVILHSLLGALVGGGSLWLVRWLYFKLRKVEGMGLGDIKMMLMVGVYLGWQLTLLTIFIGSFLGALIGVLLIALRGGNMKMEIPFGVFLGPASIIALLVGRQIITWYTGMYQ